jgi:hypothetical protein
MIAARLFLLLAACFALAAPAAAQEPGSGGLPPAQPAIAGPATVCGSAFALRLAAGESARRQEGTDFTLFHVAAADGPLMFYEGNFPQAHDEEVRTGQDFPAIVAVHDGRSAEAKARSHVRDRLLTGEAFRAACPGAGSARRAAWDGDFNYEVSEYVGPGYYCGGGFVVRLEAGERILFLDPHIDFARMVIHLGGHRAQAFLSLTTPERRGSAVPGVRGGPLRQTTIGDVAVYEVGDPPAVMTLESPDFHGHAQDDWFFSRVDLSDGAQRSLTCLDRR